MAFVFLIEVESYPPKYLSKSTSLKDQIDVFKSIKKETVFTGAHRDAVYNSKLEKCQEFDCTRFYSSGVTTGEITLCTECPPFVPRGPGDDIDGACSAHTTLSSINFTPPPEYRVTNADSNSLNTYNSWKTSSATNGFLSRSGYWLGLPLCGGGGGDEEYSCIVNCQSGIVSGCFKNSGGSGATFGDTYTIGGQTYQVYDPMQIALAGLTPNGGSFPLLSGNPLSSGTKGNGNCGTPITTIPAGGGGGGDSNCLSGSAGSSCPSNSYAPISSDEAFPEAIAIFGDYSGSVISTGSNCYNYGGSLSVETNKFGLGGSSSGLTPVTPAAAGITGSSGSCGECIGQNLSDSYGENGPSCCQLATGDIGINGAPTTNDGGITWSSGSGSWGNFWPTNSHDEGFRKNSNVWGICGATKATSIYSVPCAPKQRCKNGKNDGISIIEIVIANPEECQCRDSIFAPGSTCAAGASTPVKYCSSSCAYEAQPIVEIGCTPAKKRYVASAAASDCDSPLNSCTGFRTITSRPGCSFKAPVTYDQFFTCPQFAPADESGELDTENLKSITETLTFAATGGSSCGGYGSCGAIGQVTLCTVTGITSTKCWNANANPAEGRERSDCPENGTYTGFFNSSMLGTWLNMGIQNNTDPENTQTIEFEGGTCCAPLIQTPWEPSPGNPAYPWRTQTCDNPYNVNNESWGNSTFSQSNCAWSNPCDSC